MIWRGKKTKHEIGNEWLSAKIFILFFLYPNPFPLLSPYYTAVFGLFYFFFFFFFNGVVFIYKVVLVSAI